MLGRTLEAVRRGRERLQPDLAALDADDPAAEDGRRRRAAVRSGRPHEIRVSRALIAARAILVRCSSSPQSRADVCPSTRRTPRGSRGRRWPPSCPDFASTSPTSWRTRGHGATVALDAAASTACAARQPRSRRRCTWRCRSSASPTGIVVRGTVTGHWRARVQRVPGRHRARTSRCTSTSCSSPTPIEGETYPLEGHELDLEQLVRDALLLELPLAPHCPEPCAAEPVPATHPDDREPSSATEHADEPRDPRWAPLAELEL